MAAVEMQANKSAANADPLRMRQAVILMICSESGARKAIKRGDWPATLHGDHYLISPDILIERWALELTHGTLGPIARDRLAGLALAARYPLDIDGLQRDCERHLQQRQRG
jgi:hypothetical protein